MHPASHPPADSVTVAVWIRAAAGAPVCRASTLDRAEQSRLQVLHHPARRHQFLAIRALRATALAESTAEAGRHCSLAHSPQWLVAATASHPLGVDVQAAPDAARMQRVAARVYPPAERAWLAQTDGVERERRWLRLWTVREATVKAGVVTLISGGPEWVDPHGQFCPPMAHASISLPDGAWLSVVVPGARSIALQVRTDPPGGIACHLPGGGPGRPNEIATGREVGP